MSVDTQSALLDGREILTPGGARDAVALPWNPHPAFPGVSLKHLLTGADTDGALSCHLVRVAPGARLESHVHAVQWELHEVVAGSGEAVIDGCAAVYAPGVMAVIPSGQGHAVAAGPEGLTLFAKFFPALL